MPRSREKKSPPTRDAAAEAAQSEPSHEEESFPFRSGRRRAIIARSVNLLGEDFDISRVGTDGKLDVAIAKVKELDGHVDAIGLGGIDVYLYAGKQRYALRDGLRLLEAAKMTPVVDGSGLKNTLEREAVRFMQDELRIDLARQARADGQRARSLRHGASAGRCRRRRALRRLHLRARQRYAGARAARVRRACREVSARRVQAAVSVLLSDRQETRRSRPSRNIPSITKKPRSSPATSTSCASSCRTGSTARSC